jgi:hypothetical protein
MAFQFESVLAAGKAFHGKDESAEYCLKDVPDPASIHPSTLKFASTAPLGKAQLHPGIRTDPSRAHQTFGKVSSSSAETSVSLMDSSMPPMAAMIVRKAEEATYLSATRLPLGKGYVHGGKVENPPSATLVPGFRFGNPGASITESAKDFIQGQGASNPEEEAIAERIYEKSHRSFKPGVQRRCNVDWAVAGVDPLNKVFGMPAASLERSAVEKCLNPQAEQPEAKPTAAALTSIIPKRTDDFRATEGYRLGQVRGRATKDFSAHPGVYGKPAQRSEAGEWGVGDCIRGDYTLENQLPDKDLGRSLTPGYRNVGMADPSRRFGLPAVRIDIAPRSLSMASSMDFGDGTSAAKLLAPSSYSDYGVGEEDFLAPLPPARLRKLFERIGTAMSDREFAVIYNHAAVNGKHTPAGKVCIQEFRDALNAVLLGREIGGECALSLAVFLPPYPPTLPRALFATAHTPTRTIITPR